LHKKNSSLYKNIETSLCSRYHSNWLHLYRKSPLIDSYHCLSL